MDVPITKARRRYGGEALRVITGIEDLVSKGSFVPSTEGIDIIPSLLFGKGDFVRRQTHDIAIFFVEFALSANQFAGQKAIDER